MEDPKERALKSLRDIVSPGRGSSQREQAVKEFVRALEELHSQGRKGDIEEVAHEASKKMRNIAVLTDEIWSRKEELLGRGVGHFFHAVIRYLREKDPVVLSSYIDKVPRISLLALAAHHDIPSIKRLDDGAVYLLTALLREVKNYRKFFRLLGRAPLRKYVKLYSTIRKYLESMEIKPSDTYSLRKIIQSIGFSEENIDRHSRSMGRTISWPEYIVHRLDELINLVGVDLEGYEIHPHDKKHLKPYLYAYYKRIDDGLKKAKGEEFFRYKFGEHHTLILRIIEELKKINARKRKYRYEVPDNYVTHLLAQVIHYREIKKRGMRLVAPHHNPWVR